MLTFLRRIRRSLIESGSVRKYLIYAIGEIALVVIGILIALQINNWNEERKLLKVKRIYIENLLEDLTSDTVNISELVDFCNTGQLRIKQYFEFFESQSVNFSSAEFLDSAMQAEHCCRRYFPVNSTFQEMQASGNLKLLSKDLRDALIDLEHQQEFDQIHNDRMISNWLGRWEQFKNFIPVTKKGKSYFMRRQVYSERDSEMALFHFHHVLESNNDVLQSTKNGALNVKYQIIEIIQLLKEE